MFKVHKQATTISEVQNHEDGFSISTQDGFGLFLSSEHGCVPCMDDEISIYTLNGFGTMVRGVDINRKTVFFKTDDHMEREREEWLEQSQKEKRERFAQEKNQLDADYQELPDVFKARIDRRRENNPDFRVEFESYEMTCCKFALILVERFETPEEIQKFQNGELKDIQIDEIDEWGMSGNQVGCASILAQCYIETPEKVPDIIGAMSPLVGSVEYGDVPREKSA